MLRREYEFCMGHTLSRHAGKCQHLHGHNYQLTVEVEGNVDGYSGMVMDFSDLNDSVESILKQYDHHFYIHRADSRWEALVSLDDWVVGVDFQPTAENLLGLMVAQLKTELAMRWGVTLTRAMLRETEGSYAEVRCS